MYFNFVSMFKNVAKISLMYSCHSVLLTAFGARVCAVVIGGWLRSIEVPRDSVAIKGAL